MKLFERVSPDSAIIAVLIAVTICARLISFAYLSSLAGANPSASQYPLVAGDSSYYAHWADALLANRAYEDPAGVPLRVQPPGYPALLAAIKVVTGSVIPVVILQILLAGFAAVLIYLMARTLVPRAFALLPALVYGIDPMVVFTDSAVMTDGLFSALLVCIVYLAFFLPAPASAKAGGQAGQSHIRAPALSTPSLTAQSRMKGIARWGLAGLLLGIATMIRPISQFLIIVFPAMYLLREWLAVRGSNPMRGEHEVGHHIKAVGVFVVAFALVVVPWMVRNQFTFGSFEISVLGPHNLLYNDARGFLAWRTLAETSSPLPAILVMRHVGDPVFAEVGKEIAAGLAGITPPGGNPANYEGPLAFQYIMRDPFRYAYFHAVNTLPFFFSSSFASYGQIVRQLRSNEGFFAPVTLSILDSLRKIRHPENANSFIVAIRGLAPIALEMFWWLVVALFALAALILRRKDFAILLCAVLVAYFAALTGPMSNSRYRIPAEPYLLILAAAGAHALISRMREKSR